MWISKYLVLYSKNLHDLMNKVNELMDKNEGWQPQGGVSVRKDAFYQAMVKE